MKQCGIYLIVNTANSKVLVGSSSDIKARWRVHRGSCRTGKHANPHFQHAWDKYKEDSFEFFILEECSREQLLPREDYWMAYYKSTSPEFGYNMKSALGGFRSPETIMKLRMSKLGTVLPQEVRDKIAKAHLGVKRGPMPESVKNKLRMSNLGQKRSVATVARIKAAAATRVPMSEETRNKLRLLRLGKHMSAATKAKMRLVRLGRKASASARQKMSESFRNRIVSDATRAKMSLARLGRPLSAQTRAKIGRGQSLWQKNRRLRIERANSATEKGQITDIFPLETSRI